MFSHKQTTQFKLFCEKYTICPGISGTKSLSLSQEMYNYVQESQYLTLRHPETLLKHLSQRAFTRPFCLSGGLDAWSSFP